MKTELINVVRFLKASQTKSDLYVDSLPSQMSEMIIDNDYSQTQYSMMDAVMESLFGDMYEAIWWFLIEWNPIKNPSFWLEDKSEVKITCENDFYEYLKGC